MHAVLGVDLKALTCGVFDDLINTGWAIALCRLIVERQILCDRDTGVNEREMAGLILFMVSVGQEDRGQTIETDDVIRLWVYNFFTFRGRFHHRVIWPSIIKCERQFAAKDVLVNPHHACSG